MTYTLIITKDYFNSFFNALKEKFPCMTMTQNDTFILHIHVLLPSALNIMFPTYTCSLTYKIRSEYCKNIILYNQKYKLRRLSVIRCYIVMLTPIRIVVRVCVRSFCPFLWKVLSSWLSRDEDGFPLIMSKTKQSKVKISKI